MQLNIVFMSSIVKMSSSIMVFAHHWCVCECVVLYCIVLSSQTRQEQFQNPPRCIRHYCVGVLFRESCQALHIYTTVLYGIQWAGSVSPDSCPNSAQLRRVEMSSFYLHCQTEKHTAVDKADLFSSAQTSHMLNAKCWCAYSIAQHFIRVH